MCDDGGTLELVRVSSAVDVAGLGSVTEQLELALSAIDGVHSDGTLGAVTTVLSAEFDELERGNYDSESNVIVLNADGVRPRLTFLHELAHAIDFYGFGDGTCSNASDHPSLVLWRMAVTNNDSCRRWVAGASGKDISRVDSGRLFTPDAYMKEDFVEMLLAQELWARSYAQYIMVRSGNDLLFEEFETIKLLEPWQVYHQYWESDEFVPIGAAIDCAFRERGWLS